MFKMSFNKITEEDTRYFESIIGEEYVIFDKAKMQGYDHDETEDFSFYPEVVVKPGTPDEISKILSYCTAHELSVTPRAAGTGLSGGALAIHGGVLLSIERLNRILDIDERNLQVSVESGVITQVLQDAVIEKGLFYPPDPSSRGTCFIGGNIAENSGGPKAVKYGVVKDYVLNLEVVLPNGDIIWTGANVLKNSTGYNLTQLLVGSEGTLGIVTKIVLRLIPYPSNNLVMLIPFKSAEKACEMVSAVFRAGLTPSCLEFMERDAIDKAIDWLGNAVSIQVEPDTTAHLLVEVDGNNLEVLMQECEKIALIAEEYEAQEILFADSEKQKEDLWMLRRNVAHGVKSTSVYKEEDTVVPRAELAVLLKGVKDIGAKYGFQSICYGHAGDGNLHVNIVKGDLSDHQWDELLPQGIREIFELVVSLNGTLSGEHGIGYVQKQYMDIAFNNAQLDVMKGIKKVFDPKGILNPGKIFS